MNGTNHDREVTMQPSVALAQAHVNLQESILVAAREERDRLAEQPLSGDFVARARLRSAYEGACAAYEERKAKVARARAVLIAAKREERRREHHAA